VSDQNNPLIEQQTPNSEANSKGPSAQVPATARDDAVTVLTGTPVADENALARGTIVAGYEIEHVLGRGGMGVVYRARQLSLGRVVALKTIYVEDDTGPATLSRFRLEAEAIAKLQHPNIVQIFEVGQHQGRPFFSLEYVDSGSLARQLKRSLPAMRQAAALIATLASAIQHAHERGIVHRDLKPGNILLAGSTRREPDPAPVDTRQGQPTVPAADPWFMTPKITDFGLAKYFGQARAEQLTVSGELLGTPSYMAPEQAAGAVNDIGPATDIYALGAILYEMLTGRPPFRDGIVSEIIAQVRHEMPTPPRRLRPSVPRDLEVICLKCLEKDPRQRYASGEDLAADLTAFLAGGAIKAQPPSLTARLRHAIRRRPTLSLAVAVAILATLGFLVSVVWFDKVATAFLAILCMLGASAWYGARLQAALQWSKQEQLRAERNAQRLFLLLETTHRLVTVKAPDELLRVLGEATTRLLDAERATIYLVDRERQELWSKVALGDNVGEIRVPLGQGIAGTVAHSGETLLLDNPYADARFNQEVDRRTGYVTRNLLTLPMVAGNGEIVGVFQVLNKREGAFTQEDAEILTALAVSAAQSVELQRQKSA
jgi:serine/threonine-protein kinase